MKISTRGRYALRVMVDLADNFDAGFISLKSIADRQKISLKYVESIMTNLSNHKLVDAKSGKNGGYHLSKNPGEYTALEILEVVEGDMSPVDCLSCPTPCEQKLYCKTLPMWEGFKKLIKDYFSSITLLDLKKNTERFDCGAGI